MSTPFFEILPADPDRAEEFARLCQPIYASVYPNEKYSILPEYYALENFLTADTLDYFRRILTTSETQAAWFACMDSVIVGAVGISDEGDHFEARAFYVREDLQGIGIGKALWRKVLDRWKRSVPLRVEVAETNARTIALYERWGFQRLPELGVRLRHWPEWPDGVANGFIFLEMPASRA